jgi:DNA helicase-2/ATP-dependent DNA helicase PcrA
MWGIFKKRDREKIVDDNRIFTRKIDNKEDLLKKDLKRELERNIKNLEKREVKEIDTSLLNKSYKIDYKNSLNEEQLKALTSIEGQYLVIAGAGSGKTRTIIYRTAFLLEQGIKEEEILMVTFTRKAADEMKSRLETLLERDIKVEIGTFHSFCMKLMGKNRKLFNLEKIVIIDEKEKKSILGVIIREKRLKLEIGKERVLNIIEGLEKRKNIEDILTEKEKEYRETLENLIRDYKKYKKINRLFDFNDLIDKVLIKLKSDIDFRRYIQKKYRYIIVDEYQDTDKKQRDILKMICGKDGNLMVVGDDYQSIYGFRGAEFENILRFNEDFPNSYLIKLEKNYRSTEEIVEYSNKIASKFHLKYNKVSKSTGRKGDKPKILKFKDENLQNKFIIEKILKFQKDGINYGDMAIIYRDRYSVIKLEKLLLENSIPYEKKIDNSVQDFEIELYLKLLNLKREPKNILYWEDILEYIPKNSKISIFDILDGKEKNSKILKICKWLEKNCSLEESLKISMNLMEDIIQDRVLKFGKIDEINSKINLNIDLEKYIREFNRDLTRKDNVDKISLISVHSSKGLEWEVVFIPMMLEGIFPSSLSGENLEEEKRLYYVACSRSKEFLYLLYPEYFYEKLGYFNKKSSFLTL